MQGFFSKKEVTTLSQAVEKTLTCSHCGLYKLCTTPKMAPYGNFRKKIMNIGEAPGEVEDKMGKPFQGKTGQLLQHTYKKLGIDLFEDCININASLCRPVDRQTSNRPPSNQELDCCRRLILRHITQYKPKVIVLFGNAAVYSLIGHRWKRDLGGITKWRGWTIPDQDFNAWLCPTFHPSFIERSEENDINTIWQQDLKRAIGKLAEPFVIQQDPEIHYIDNLNVLADIKSDFAFDYETTGLKPHAIGHRIICTAVAPSESYAYVFPMPTSRKQCQPFIDLLLNPKLGKIAQNMKFEYAWTKERLRVEVQNWLWDTMLMSHVLDNRPGATSLKFQTYVNFGVVDYASEITPYLQAKEQNNGNAINRIYELLAKPDGMQQLLRYCALDAVYEYRLAMKQRENILPF